MYNQGSLKWLIWKTGTTADRSIEVAYGDKEYNETIIQIREKTVRPVHVLVTTTIYLAQDVIRV